MSQMLPDHLRQILTLPSGIRIGFAEYGNLRGRPVIYLHGTPSSRLEVGGWQDLYAELTVRLIVPDRPGIGLSSSTPQRRVIDYPDQISALAQHLHLEHFDLLCGSGGAPYILACARFLPQGMLGRVGIIAGSAPPEAGNGCLSLLARIGPMLWRYPRFMTFLLKHVEQRYAQDPDPKMYETAIRKQIAWLSASDREACEQDFEHIVAGVREAYAQGSEGVAWDLYLMTQPWGFDLCEIRHRDITLWCGTKDANTPVQWSRWMAERLEGSRLLEMEGLTHYSIFTVENVRTILQSFLQS